MSTAYIVWTIIAFLVSALIWRLYGKSVGRIVLFLLLLFIGLSCISIDLGFASLLIGVPLWLRDSRRTRLVCATILLLFQFALLGPTFVTSMRAVAKKVYQSEDRQTSYRKAYFEGASSMQDYLATAMVQPVALYSIVFAVLIFVPCREKREKSQPTPAGDAETSAPEE